MSENKNVKRQQEAARAMQQKQKFDLKQYGMLIALGVIILFFYVLTGGKLLKPMNVSNLIFQNAYVIILAIGMLLCILTGGNIDTRLLANVLLRDLARSGRLARLRLSLQDRPGALLKVMQEFDEHNVNILEIYHQRIFTNLPAKGLVTDIECEARDREQLEGLVAALRARGYSVSHVELN